MLNVAVREPSALGSKLTVKVVEPAAAIDVEGTTVIVKSAAFVPPIVTYGLEPDIFNADVPVFWMVNTRVIVPLEVATEPKSVQSVVEGVASPSVIETEFPWTFISGPVPIPWIAKS